MEMDFFAKLLELSYTSDPIIRQELASQARLIALGTESFSEWPYAPRQFWDAESFGWENKVLKSVRSVIRKELSFLKGDNLDLGAGTISATENSLVVDYSERMLRLNSSRNKLLADVHDLPFSENSFDSVTGVFLLSYVDVEKVFEEVRRVLKPGGVAVFVQSVVRDFYRLHHKNSYDSVALKILLESNGFDCESFTRRIDNNSVSFLIAKLF